MSEKRLTPLLVGPCPLEWKQPFIEDVTELLTNGFVGPSLPHQTENSKTGVCYLQGFNVRPNKLDLTRTTWVTHSFHAKNRKSQLQEGDVLVVQSGHIGTAAVVPKEAAGVNCHAVIICRFKSSIVDPNFASQYLNSQVGQARLRGLHVGSSLPHINTSELGRFKLPLPLLHEQKKLANLLVTWDAAIQKSEQLIAAKTRRKAGLLRELLTGRKRVGRFRTEWREWRLGQLFQERVESDRSDLPLLSITREEGVVPRDGIDRKDTSSEDKSKYLRICPGDIGYNTMRMWQGVSALSRHEGIVSPAYTVCVPGRDIGGNFASYLFKLPQVIHVFLRYSQGLTSDTWNLKFHHFAEVRVRIPGIEEQGAIASILAVLDEDLALLKSQRDVLAQQKRGLMQKLLAGQWRLPIAQETIV
jgi:type I restriction enzyme, S subunit